MPIYLTVGINFVDHVLKFSLGRVLSERPHDGSQLLGGDGAVAILVEQGEGLLELGDLFFGQLVCLKIGKENERSNKCFTSEKLLQKDSQIRRRQISTVLSKKLTNILFF